MIIDEDYIKENKDLIIKEILAGKIFIYPTDTIYGIGCNASNEGSVAKIRVLKQRETKPFSVIVPDLNWIKNNCVVNEEVENHLEKLPGAYTFFLKLKNKEIISDGINPKGDGTVGVRIPDHWFTKLISEANIHFITTSVNVAGQPFMTSIEDADEAIKNSVDYIIYEGPIIGRESTKIDFIK
ncbi:MAG: L-threonylcarbamoyladenylate synthase [Patescibacteria group bacterium]